MQKSFLKAISKNFLTVAPFILTLGAIALILWDAGFSQAETTQQFTNNLYPWALGILLLTIPLRFIFLKSTGEQKKRWLIDTFLWLALMGLFLSLEPFAGFASTFSRTEKTVLFFVLIFCFLKEILIFTKNIKYQQTHPSIIFAVSFAGLIVAGTLLLLLPRATHTGITPTDALFTSTSAVCVTGLIVVDTGSYFTQFGQTIILVLIQLGGIGIMTFTSFFAFFFRGGVSYRNLILLGNLTNESKMSEIMQTLKKILLFTFIIEAIGMALILCHLPKNYADSTAQELFFALFHSISAFCNAGFSTLENSLFEYQFRFSYALHMIIALLFIIGGLGFPVLLNLYIYVKITLKKTWRKLNKLPHSPDKNRIMTLNSKLVLYITGILIFSGTLIFFLLEYKNTLDTHQGVGKVITAFFSAVTPRTAGFNTVDTGQLHLTTLVVIIGLMWIGASPASTGGGIKTSTFALSVLNILSMARGRNRVEFAKRQVDGFSINRAFAFMAMAIAIIGLVIFALLITEPEKSIENLAFEAFSAFSTVGLSRGITADLSIAGRYIIVLTMFIGRVGALTIMIALLRKPRKWQYGYPSEQILIN